MKLRLLPFFAAALIAASPLCADIVRTSTGQRRVDLDKMELQPFPAEAWSKLTAWSNGAALTEQSIQNKPVLIMTWASWHPASLKSLALAQKMSDTFGPQGLIVVGVHNKTGWENAGEAATSHGAKFLMAHDSTGEFRKAIKCDHDPDFYVIDRAGHLRYAAVASQSLEEACSGVTAETPQQAADVPGAIKAKTAAELADSQKIETVRSGLDRMPPVPPGYTKPGDEAYKEASWPKISEKNGKDFGLLDGENKPVTPKLTFTPAGFFPAKPETVGRATVVYMWHPEVLASFDKVIPIMDQLQVAMARDVAVVGALVPVGKLDQNRQLQFGQAPDSPEKVIAKVREFVSTRQFKHALAADATGSSLASLGNIRLTPPFCIIASSDGLIRWAGNPVSADFRYALDAVLANDPGVIARRAADQKYLREAK